MDDFHYRTRIGPDGEVHLHGVPLPSGQEVDIIVEVRSNEKGNILKTSLAGVPVEYTAPFDPAVNPDEWEANS